MRGKSPITGKEELCIEGLSVGYGARFFQDGIDAVYYVAQENYPIEFSETEFELISSGKSNSLVKAKIITGRTHQIRVHSKYKGHPIVGDTKYGDPLYNKELQLTGLNRMLLHAKSIKFSNMGIEQSAPLPPVFKDYV